MGTYRRSAEHVKRLWDCRGVEMPARKCECIWKGGRRRKRGKDKITYEVRGAREKMFVAPLGVPLRFFLPNSVGPKCFLVFLKINWNKLEAVRQAATWNRSDRLLRRKIRFWMNEKLQVPCHQYTKWAILTLNWPWDKWQRCWQI